MAFNRNTAISTVKNMITDKNYLSTITHYRKMGEAGLVKAMQSTNLAANEWKVATLLITLTEKLNNGPDFSNPLAEQIWNEQGQKLTQYGDGAFRLSEKQLAVIARYFMQHTLSVEFA